LAIEHFDSSVNDTFNVLQLVIVANPAQ